jgi:chaperonin GroEL
MSILVKESKSLDSEIKCTEGYQFDRGWESPQFAKDGEREVVLKDVDVLMWTGKVSNANDMLTFLQYYAKNCSGRSLLIISEGLEGEVLPMMIVNHLRGTLPNCAVRPPGYGEDRKEQLLDIAAVVGAELGEDTITSLNSFLSIQAIRKNEFQLVNGCIPGFGVAEEVRITRDQCTISGGKGAPELKQKRIEAIEAHLDSDDLSDYDKEKYQTRLARLKGGVAEVLIGGSSESEVTEKKQRAEDALNAVKAALEEGTIVGGGIGLIRACNEVEESLPDLGANIGKQVLSEREGMIAVLHAKAEPFGIICENVHEDGLDVMSKVLSATVEGGIPTERVGYDARTNEVVDAVTRNILDPVKVTRHALRNAVSCASMLYTTDTVIIHDPDEPERAGGPMY